MMGAVSILTENLIFLIDFNCIFIYKKKKNLQLSESVQEVQTFLHSSVIKTFLRWYRQLVIFSKKIDIRLIGWLVVLRRINFFQVL